MKAPKIQVDQIPGSPVDVALEMASRGWSVFPVVGKRPAVKRGVYAASQDSDEIREMFKRAPKATGVAGSCEGRLIIDVDPRNGGETLEGLPPTRIHWSGRGDGGCHLVYRLPAGFDESRLSSSTSQLAPGVDVKTGKGSYVLLPGSVHPDTGGRYTTNNVEERLAPPELLELLEHDPNQERTSAKGEGKKGSTLAQLLSTPPEIGDRNDWLTRVAGHYAYMYRSDRSSYCTMVEVANRLLRQPLDAAEVGKISDSIWTAELETYLDPALEDRLEEANGWLVSGGGCLLTLAYEGVGKNRLKVPYELCAFDLRVRAKVWNPQEDAWVYECDLVQKKSPNESERVYVNALDFGNPRTARAFLAKRSLSVGSGADLVHRNYDWCSRLLMYLDSQDAPVRTMTTHLGWNMDEEGYVTHAGTIDKNGLRESARVVLSPDLAWVTDTYGISETPKYAQEVLREVLHFQEPYTVSLFASWWSATLVKQWVKPRVSMFPVCAVEAASGSGKTTGFFSFMAGLAGSTSGEGHYTPAVLRNRLASNLNGVTWVDDMENPEALFDIVRVLTAGGSLSKMDGNNNPRKFELVGSLLLSGEALGFGSQRALRDRVLLLTPPPPQGRVSRHDPKRAQWLDVVELRDRLAKIGGPEVLSGHFLALGASLAPKIPGWFSEAREDLRKAGRSTDRALVTLVGARVLDHLAGGDLELPDGQGELHTPYWYVQQRLVVQENQSIEQRLESSFGGQALEADNTLTTKIIPAYLAQFGSGGVVMPARAVVVDEAKREVAVNVNRLASWWWDHTRGRVNLRTESSEALLAQVKQLREVYPDSVASARRRLDGGRNNSAQRVWVLSGEVFESISGRLEYF